MTDHRRSWQPEGLRKDRADHINNNKLYLRRDSCFSLRYLPVPQEGCSSLLVCLGHVNVLWLFEMIPFFMLLDVISFTVQTGENGVLEEASGLPKEEVGAKIHIWELVGWING